MEKLAKPQSKISEKEAFEMLGTAIEEVETLTRAFEIISEVFEQAEEEKINFEGCSNQFVLN